MNGIWRGSVAALLGHALTAPGVDAAGRGVACLAAIVLVAGWRARVTTSMILLAGVLGGLRLQDRVHDALLWQEEPRSRVRLRVIDVRRSSVLAQIATTGLPTVTAWVGGIDHARPGERWEGVFTPYPLMATRNPDDRDGTRNGLANGAVLRGRLVDEIRLAHVETPPWNLRLRDAAHRRWVERFGDGAGLWTALLLADRRGLEEESRSRLQQQGLAHLLALSGLHVGILAGVLMWPWRRHGPVVWVAAVPILVAWTLLAGAGASMVRAVGMVAWIAVARVRGTGARPLDALAAIALVETVVRPEVVCGIGWWLSYAATAAILRTLPWLNGRPWWQCALLVSCAAQTATAAWTLDAFGRLPWAAPIVQLVVGPAFTLLLSVGGIGAVLALGHGPVADAGAGASALLAHGFGGLVSLSTATGRLALHHPGWEGGSWALALGLSALAILPFAWTRSRALAVGLLAIAMVVSVHVPAMLGPVHRWVSLDVGQGDGGVFHCRRRLLVIDAGPYSSGSLPADRVLLPYLARRNAREATLLLTHGHLDHTAGTASLVGSGRIAALAMAAADSSHEWARGLAVMAREERVAVRWVAAGDTLWSDCCEAICLWPAAATTFADANDRSLVVRLGPRRSPLLTTGDLERHAERELLEVLERERRGEVAAWSLKVAHHGGNTGTDEALLQWLAPTHALISCGHGNRYGHPHPDLLGRLHACGARIGRTDLEGALELRWTRSDRAPAMVRHGRRPSGAVSVDALLGRTYAAFVASP